MTLVKNVRALPDDVRANPHRVAAAIACPAFGGAEEVCADAGAPIFFVDHEALDLGVTAADEILARPHGGPSDHTGVVFGDEHFSLAIPPGEAFRDLRNGNAISQLFHQTADARRIFRPRPAHDQAKRTSTSISVSNT
ncbi:MAG: hypothetical protein WB615_08995, partial [Candidatus Tumulicola sp.]